MSECVHGFPQGYSKQYCQDCREESLESELSNTLKLLATERDAFGKKETEMMAELKRVRKELIKLKNEKVN